MKQYLLEQLVSSGDLTIETILVRLGVAAVLSVFVFMAYRLSHLSGIYSKKFNVSLITLTLITTMVMIVIGNNIALSLGMVGALSIVRFRTAIKDSRDTVYIFWTIVVGICCGAGDYMVAAVGTAFVFVLMVLFGSIKNDSRILLIIRTTRMNEMPVESLIFRFYDRKAILRVKNTTDESIEFIFELTKKLLDEKEKNNSITKEVYELGNIDYFNIVTQNDEITG